MKGVRVWIQINFVVWLFRPGGRSGRTVWPDFSGKREVERSAEVGKREI